MRALDEIKKLAKEASLKDFDCAAREACEHILKMEPSNDAFLFRLAESLLGLGLFSKAEAVLKLIEKVPDSKKWRVSLLRAEVAAGLHKIELANEFYREALSLKPERTYTWVFYAAFLAKQEKFEPAIKVLESCLAAKATGDRDEVFYLLGAYRMVLREYSRAREALERAICLANNNYPEAQQCLEDLEFLDSLSTQVGGDFRR